AATRVAERGDDLAEAGVAADRGGLQTRRALELEERHVVRHVVPQHGRRVRAAVADVGDADARGAPDHVVVRQHEAGGADHDPGAGGRAAFVAEGRADVRDRRVDGRRDVPYGAVREGRDGENGGGNGDESHAGSI